ISSDEFEKTKNKYNSIWLPPYMPIEASFNKHKFGAFNNRILFVGNLFMPNNVGGIIWYLKNVHSDLLGYDKKIKLTIAGNAKNGISSELQEAINIYPKDAIELIKSPTDSELKKIYDNHCIFINPMLNGAGVKLKNLDAMRNSFYVVTTSVGAEGTGVENKKTSVVADNPEDFRDAIIFGLKSENSEVIAHNAYNLIKNNFDIKSILKKIL
ncbi:glycosyltransferase family 4 protein, partial [Shigella sonnei]|nr:glycosyltransferase family 4 protein [Shigella sonnei]